MPTCHTPRGPLRLVAIPVPPPPNPNVALTVDADVEKIKAAKVGHLTIAEAIADTVAKIGENMNLRRASPLSVGKGTIASYVHNSVDEGIGKIGVLVALESSGKADEL